MAGSLLTAKVSLELTGVRKLRAEMIRAVKSAAKDAEKAAKIRPQIDDKNLRNQMGRAAKAGAREFERIKPRINVDTRQADQKLHLLRNTAEKTFNGVSKAINIGPSGGISALITGIAALAPAVAGIGLTVIPALGGLAASLLTAGAGAGAFALVAVPAFGKVQSAAKALSKAQNQLTLATTKAQRASAIKAETKALQGLSGPERNAVRQYTAFTHAVTQFQHSVEPSAFPVIAGGLKLISSNLPKLRPLILGSASAFTLLESKAQKALNQPFWHNFVTFLGKDAHNSLVDFGRVAGNTFTGFAGLIQGFDPQVTAARGTLVKFSGDFAKFGESVAAGTNKAFKKFVIFTSSLKPQVHATLGSLGSVVATAFVGVAPAIKPSLKLLQDLANGVKPIVKAVGQALPGIIGSIDKIVIAAQPLVAALAKPFTQGVALAIKGVASGLTTVADELKKLPPGVISAIGKALGILVGAALISKITGLSKLAGYISGIGGAAGGATGKVRGFATAELEMNAAGAGGGLSGVAGKIIPIGTAAGGATGKIRNLGSAIAALGRLVIPAAIGVQIGLIVAKSKPVQDLATKFENVRNSAEKLPGPLGYAAKGFNSIAGSISDLIGNTTVVAGKINSVGYYLWKLPNGKIIKISIKDAASRILASTKAKAEALDHSRNVIKLGVKDAASGLIKGAINLVRGIPKSHTTTLRAQDRAGGLIKSISRQLGGLPKLHSTTLRVQDRSSGAVSAAQSRINSLHGKTVYVDVITRQSKIGTGPLRAFAEGGITPGGQVIVGENGPELVDLPAGSHVRTAKATAQVMSQRFGVPKIKIGQLHAIGGSLVKAIAAGMGAGRTLDSINNATQLVIARINSSFKPTAGRSLLIQQATIINHQLKKLYGERAAIASKLQQASELAAGVSSNAQSFADVTGVQKVTPTGVLAFLKGKLNAIRYFNRNITLLSKRHFSKQLLAQIIAAGPDVGGPVAAALVKMSPGQLKYANYLESSIIKASGKLGSTAVNIELGKGAAFDFVKSLQKQEKTLDLLMSRLAHTFAKQIGHTFHIKGYAQGGITPGGPVLVGENGPEIADLPSGTRIHPNTGTNASQTAVLDPAQIAAIFGQALSHARFDMTPQGWRILTQRITTQQKVNLGRGLA